MPPRTECGLLLALTLAGGCEGTCPGRRPSCERSYPAARLAVHAEGDWTSRGVWSDAEGVARGALSEGADWSVAGLAGQIVVGQPEARRAILVRPPQGSSRLAELAVTSWAVDEQGFGAVVATADDALWIAAPDAREGRGLVAAWHDPLAAHPPDLVLVGGAPGDRLGAALAPCPDLTGDGRPDWLVAAPRRTAEDDVAGAVFLVPSEATGEHVVEELAEPWSGSARGERLGSALACADLLGDGAPELVIGAPFAGEDRQGRVYLLPSDAAPGAAAEAALLSLHGTEPDAWLGASLVTGVFSGEEALVAGAPGALRGLGEAHYFETDDLASGTASTVFLGDPGRTRTDHVGTSLSAGDLDGDGFSDLAVGAPDWSTASAHDTGRLFLWLGGPEGWGPDLVAGLDESRTIEGNQPFQRVGGAVTFVDLDGDGADELVLATRSPE